MKKKSNYRRSGSKAKDREQKCESTSKTDPKEVERSKSNDWRWYAQNEQLLRDTASYSYNYPLGSIVRRTRTGDQPADTNSIPGVMAVHTVPAFGGSQSPTSAINVAVRNIYSFVRHANSGHTNYDAPDLGIYLMAMDSLYSFLSYLRRIYGVVMTFSYTNRYYPTAVVNAMDVDFEDIHRNIADFRAYINSLAVKVGSMCVPASMSYFTRHMWMYEGYYVDTDQDKAQTYLYVPDGFYKYTLNNVDQSGALELTLLRPQGFHVASSGVADLDLLTFKDLHDYGDALLAPILSSEDMNIMSGDILKAFGSNGIYMIPMIPENYVVLPTYNEEVLDQINNATLVGFPTKATNPSSSGSAFINMLIQDPTHGWLMNPLQFKVTTPGAVTNIISFNADALTSKKMINFNHGDIGPANTMVASRLTQCIPPSKINSGTGFDSVTNGSMLIKSYDTTTGGDIDTDPWNTIGSDVATYAVIYYYANGGLMASEGMSTVLCSYLPGYEATTTEKLQALVTHVQQDAFRINMLSMFDRHPRIAFQFGITDPSITGDPAQNVVVGDYLCDLGDINYYTIVDQSDLASMAETALLSMLNVTQYGRQA